jgi:hypothetical protein
MDKRHLGSRFEEFLEKEGIPEECRASAIKFKFEYKRESTKDQPRRKTKPDRGIGGG